MPSTVSSESPIDRQCQTLYRHALEMLSQAGLPHLVGGAYAFEHYTGLARHTKDFDIFVMKDDCDAVLETLATRGFATELTFPHWLGKARCGGIYVDVIFGAGNGVTAVDETWFDHAVEAEMFDHAVRLVPAEEMIWSKSFIAERERYDGADIAHLLRARADALDWARLLRRFGAYWRVLLAHIVLFGFVYPAERTSIPAWVMRELTSRLHAQVETPAPPEEAKLCRGPLLSRGQYLVDITHWGYEDPRLQPRGRMTPEDVEGWTAGIALDGDGAASE
jgi:hypothetical protein